MRRRLELRTSLAVIAAVLLATMGVGQVHTAHASVRMATQDAPILSSSVIDGVMVMYRDQSSPTGPITDARLARLQASALSRGLMLQYQRQLGIGAYLLRLLTPAPLAGAVSNMFVDMQQNDPDIEWVLPDLPMKPTAEMLTNDPLLSYQWNLGENNGIHAFQAWDEQWQPAAGELGHGYVPDLGHGPRLVRYGQYSGNWAYKLITGDFDCKPETFKSTMTPTGDPDPDVVKRCEVSPYWYSVGSEGSTISLGVGVTKWVRYGFGDSWKFKKVTGGAPCTVTWFGGDPWDGQAKICQAEDRTDGGGVVAKEGDTFSLSSPQTVRYGYIDHWVYASVPAFTPVKCTVGTKANGDPFTTDPFFGEFKHCEIVKSVGSGQTVAVLDTGFVQHPDMEGKELPGWNFVDNNNDIADHGTGAPGCPLPPNVSSWHGLKVASVIGAATNNRNSIAGVAPMAKVAVDKVTQDCRFVTSNVMDALVWAAGGAVPSVPVANPSPARVINLSAGQNYPGPCDAAWRSAIAKLDRLGAILVTAAGNSSALIQAAPANCEGAVVVAALDRSGQRASFSSFGDNVSLSAPGVDIPALSNEGKVSPSSTYSTAIEAGTSFAAPEVAAVAALMLGKNPSLSVGNLRNRLALSARPFSRGCAGCGRGALDAERALRSAEAITTKREPDGTEGLANYISAPADVSATFNGNPSIDVYRFDLPPYGFSGVQIATDARSDVSCTYSVVNPVTNGRQGPIPCNSSFQNLANNAVRVYVTISGGPDIQGQKYTLTTSW